MVVVNEQEFLGMKLDKAKQEGIEEGRKAAVPLAPGQASLSIEEMTDLKTAVVKAEAERNFSKQLLDERVSGWRMD